MDMDGTILTCVLLVCITLIALSVIGQISQNALIEKKNENLRLLLKLKEVYKEIGMEELDIERDKDKKTEN